MPKMTQQDWEDGAIATKGDVRRLRERVETLERVIEILLDVIEATMPVRKSDEELLPIGDIKNDLTEHVSDCDVHNPPAEPAGPCTCKGGKNDLSHKIEDEWWSRQSAVEAMRSVLDTPGEDGFHIQNANGRFYIDKQNGKAWKRGKDGTWELQNAYL